MSYEYDYEDLWGDYGDYGPKERVYTYIDYLIWLIFPFAAIGFVSSITTLVFVALFPKPLKTTIIHCIVLCVSSTLTCMISIAQAASWEIKADLKTRGEDTEFIIVDYAISWITILIIGVANWLFVAFVSNRLYAIFRVNINSYVDYVTASANEIDRPSERSKPSYICGVVSVILCFGWLLPTLILPLFGMIEFYHNWLGDEAQVIDVLGFAFQHDFNHRWGSTLYVLLPIGLTVLISGFILYQTIVKLRGLKFMQGKWDKAKLTLGAILLFLVSRIPMLVYVFFAFQAYPAAPKKTGDTALDNQLASEHSTWIYVGNQSIKKDRLGPTGPFCLIFACGAAALNLPLFYICLRRFRSLCAEGNANCRQCGHCCDELGQRRPDDSDTGSTDAEARENDSALITATPATTASFLSTPNKHISSPRQSSPREGHPDNFFFNSAHHDFMLAQSNTDGSGNQMAYNKGAFV